MEKAKRNIHYSFKVSPDEDAAIIAEALRRR